VNALADPKVGKYLDENFVSSFQKVATFKIVGKAKQGGNVASYFCAPDGRVLHVIPGPVDAATLLREAQWVVETARKGIEVSKGDGGTFKAFMRKAHADKVRLDEGLTVEPVTFDPPEKQDPNDALTYRDPTGRPLAPVLPPVPIDGPDVKFHLAQEANARQLAAGAAGFAPMRDRAGRRWAVSNIGRAHLLLAGHGMGQIERLYGSVFEGILGERISTRPVEIVHPFPWYARANANGGAALTK
jgi:hypothetical protein